MSENRVKLARVPRLKETQGKLHDVSKFERTQRNLHAVSNLKRTQKIARIRNIMKSKYINTVANFKRTNKWKRRGWQWIYVKRESNLYMNTQMLGKKMLSKNKLVIWHMSSESGIFHLYKMLAMYVEFQNKLSNI